MCSILQTNTFTITVATDRRSRRSYVIFDYGRMGWSRATSFSNAPVVGYSNGQCQGFQASLTNDPAAYLNICRRLIYRIDQSFVQEIQMNRGNLALIQQKEEPAHQEVISQNLAVMQQQDKGPIFMQQEVEPAHQEVIRQMQQDKGAVFMQQENKGREPVIGHYALMQQQQEDKGREPVIGHYALMQQQQENKGREPVIGHYALMQQQQENKGREPVIGHYALMQQQQEDKA